jgi:hypothetical protein
MGAGHQLRWQEPWLFSLRMRNRQGWKRKGWLILAIFVVMMGGWYLDQNYGKGLRIGLTGAILLSLGIAVFVSFLTDLGISEVQATADGVARATYGHGVGSTLWRYQDILSFTFIPRASSGKPFALLILVLRANIVILGVPDRVPQSELVGFFRNHGVQEAQLHPT